MTTERLWGYCTEDLKERTVVCLLQRFGKH